MLIKEAKYKKVKVWQRKMISNEIHGCDECKEEIKEWPNEYSRLEVSIFKHEDSETKHLHFCSWGCVFKYIPKIKTDYFVKLPYLYFDKKEVKGASKRSAKELIKILKKLNLK